MDFAEGIHVTPSAPIPEGLLRPFGTVTGGGMDPLTGKPVVMVKWPDSPKPGHTTRTNWPLLTETTTQIGRCIKTC
ncbi:hypothetical protein AB0I10_33030 [Streptomyces sp. NPDC050636]|uniref:hypothetical protein n=1 Tax=Streptomyces sp. NPDC050636 TaxID=3154510 RepID=UPI0034124D0C